MGSSLTWSTATPRSSDTRSSSSEFSLKPLCPKIMRVEIGDPIDHLSAFRQVLSESILDRNEAAQRGAPFFNQQKQNNHFHPFVFNLITIGQTLPTRHDFP